VSSSPGTFDYAKLDWMNGVYLRALTADAYADEVVAFLDERGLDWPENRVRAMAPLVQEKVGRLGEIPDFTRFLFEDIAPDAALLDRRVLEAAEGKLAAVDEWTASELEAALKALCEELGEKPRTVYGPIRVAVTGSRVSPGLYESLELLGRETSLARLRRGAELAA
jgi:glutamyl-tRNA synthetase